MKTVNYKGVEIPKEMLPVLKAAKLKWKERDQKAWEFAELAYEIVGQYLPDLTKLLAREMSVESPSTPEGYAKAWLLFTHLRDLGHKQPFDNLYISHYITVGKAYSARLKNCNGDDGKEYVELLWAEKILLSANKFGWTIEYLRGKMKKEPGVMDDDWRNSAYKTIETIEVHIINAPRLGVSELRSSVATRVARLFINVLKWAINDDVSSPGVARDDLESLTEELCETNI